MNLAKKSPASSVLGLSLDGPRLEGGVLRRTNGSATLQKSFAASLSLDPLTNDPELVGREIRNHLDKAGIRGVRMVVSCTGSVPSASVAPVSGDDRKEPGDT